LRTTLCPDVLVAAAEPSDDLCYIDACMRLHVRAALDQKDSRQESRELLPQAILGTLGTGGGYLAGTVKVLGVSRRFRVAVSIEEQLARLPELNPFLGGYRTVAQPSPKSTELPPEILTAHRIPATPRIDSRC
jgi:hypothetical protein